MNPRYIRLTVATAAMFAATALAAGPDTKPLRADTDLPSNFSGADTGQVTQDAHASNWPGLPERQGGRAYSKIIYTTSGFRERNAESGRR